jgi:hypothetical protein
LKPQALSSYGAITPRRQREIIKSLRLKASSEDDADDLAEIGRGVLEAVRKRKMLAWSWDGQATRANWDKLAAKHNLWQLGRCFEPVNGVVI